MAKITIVSTLLLVFVAQLNAAPKNVKIRVMVSASDLPNTDPSNGKPDPFTTVLYDGNWIDASVTLPDTNNPNWPNIFTFEHNGSGLLKLVVRDKDDGFIHGNLGEGEIDVNDLINNNQASGILRDCVNDYDLPCGFISATIV